MSAFARRGACPSISRPMQTGDGLLVRLNPVAGSLSPKTLIGLCESALRHGNGMMEVTARGSLQIRGLTAQSAPSLAAEVDGLGIAARTSVPVETGPLAGLDPQEISTPMALAESIRQEIAASGLADRLGPKVSVVVDGGGQLNMNSVPADVRLVAVTKQDWLLAIAGDAHNCTPIGSFNEADALTAALTILQAIAGLGPEGRARDLDEKHLGELLHQLESLSSFTPPSVLPDISPSRGEISRHRLFQPLSAPPAPSYADNSSGEPGASIISPLEGEMSGRTEGGNIEHPSPIGIFTLHATLALGLGLPFGSIPADRLIALAKEALCLGATEIRVAPQRALLVLGLSETACASLQNSAKKLGFIIDADDPRCGIAACVGAPACASGHIATRQIAESIARDAGDLLDPPFVLHVSGCAKGCAHPGAAALTLVGSEAQHVGLVLTGTARDEPAAYVPTDRLARGFRRMAAALRIERHASETTATCLARMGHARVAAFFQQG
ncbi:precorrin-3B synthase [Pseudaminobacter arsenicus]|uniref:Precorrin-3B synthase n=1 Tax=Borborobacter arsenicus TaxID=1851146 RepID=A0A432VC33_9HYPH|nr:precorrin-3B synthase [Pseudaminobacter arsenicus]RUM99705.1 precorrin-3B synthase [Pseudaminobacter arsenicus]